jgi:2,4-dienoyl-CoA reductase (NADPH2)
MGKTFLRFLTPEVLRWLTKFWIPLGKRVVVVGGSIHGCELAEFLVKRDRKVTIVETSEVLGVEMVETNRDRLLGWLTRKGVTMITGVKYEEITDKGIVIVTKDGKKQTVEADTVALITGLAPNVELFKTLEGKVPEIHRIGDCEQPGLIVHAIHAGSRVGRAI